MVIWATARVVLFKKPLSVSSRSVSHGKDDFSGLDVFPFFCWQNEAGKQHAGEMFHVQRSYITAWLRFFGSISYIIAIQGDSL